MAVATTARRGTGMGKERPKMDMALWRNLAAYTVGTLMAMLIALLAAKAIVTAMSEM